MVTEHLPKVILTDAINPAAHDRLAEKARIFMLPPSLSREEADQVLRDELVEAHGLIVRRRLPDDLLEGPHQLKGIVRHGVGLDFIPVDSATRHGIPVANTPEVNAQSVAEYAIAAMLESARRLRYFDAQVREGNWEARKGAGAATYELHKRRLGIVGFGAIGKKIASIASGGFDMRVAAYTRTPSRLPSNVEFQPLEALFATSDFIVLACPLTNETRGMINRAVLEKAKPNLVLVNVARGPVIKEADLVDALGKGVIAGAALDVFEVQPLPEDSPLRDHPRVLLTPHLAGMTEDAEYAMGLMAVDTQLALIRGERPSNIVNNTCFEKQETT